jgi:hypothetical protein
MSITLASRKLFNGRVRQVQKILRPLVGKSGQVACCIVGAGRGRVICGRTGGNVHDYEEVWFYTRKQDIQGQYHEIWYPGRDEQEWWLERAYFSLRRVISHVAQVEDILCIHSDPQCGEPEPVASYKRGPHLHVSLAKEPLLHAHFPLNRGHLAQVLESCDSLSEAMALAIKVVSDEVVSRY